MRVYLIVYYVEDIALSKQFFSQLGLKFTEEKHGNGPIHYATKIGSTVFEIYPRGKKQVTRTRLGFDFSESNLNTTGLDNFLNKSSESIIEMDNGKKYAVVIDPNNNHIEVVW